jgi:hypothetical protein
MTVTIVTSGDLPAGTYTLTPVTPPPVAPPAASLPVPTALRALYPTLEWSDTFAGTALNLKRWGYYEYGGTNNSLADADNGGSYSLPANVIVNNGLELLASSPTPTNPASWGSGYITTWGLVSVKAPFYIEFQATCPPSKPGYWAGLCLYEASWAGATEYAEIDVLERVQPNGNPAGFQSFHPPGSAPGISNQIGAYGIDLTGTHTYGAAVDNAGNLSTWFDGTQTGKTFEAGASALQPFTVTLGMFISGNANGQAAGWAMIPTTATPSPAKLGIGYVKVFAAA